MRGAERKTETGRHRLPRLSNLRLRPFPSIILLVSLFGELTHTELSGAYVGHYSHLYKPFGYQIRLSHGKITAQYQGRIVGYRLNRIPLPNP
ncbi:MAG: hypothetical protein LBD89_04915 [Tannerellaceae bacterium]|nr:hypothetical protein [Tannerellaceae bacterium]